MRTDFIEIFNAAVEKNLSLNNAIFYKKVDNSVFDNKGRFTEGVFIALGNGDYNWAQTQYLGEDEHVSKIVVADGIMYTFFSFASKEHKGWEVSEEEIYDLKELIYPLFERTLVEKYVEHIKVEENTNSHYFIELSDTYIEDQKAKAIVDLQNVLFSSEENEPQFIQAVEEQIESIKNREYLDSKVEIVINREGYLVQFKEKYTYRDPMTNPDGITIYLDYQLRDYNLSNPMRLFPDIDKM